MATVTRLPRRRVLMLCYYYPPLQTSAIARSVGFSCRLPEHGWQPTVLTVANARDSWGIAARRAPVPPDVDIVRTPETNLDRPVSLLDTVVNKAARSLGSMRRRYYFRELCAPDPQLGWRVRRRGAELARRCDCIYVSCSPFSSALAGVSIKRRSGRPLVLDFRDAWTLNPHLLDHSAPHRWLLRRMERACLGAADRVVLNTDGALRRYREHYPEFADRFVCIPNGFDALNLPAWSPADDAPFTVMHIGTLYGDRSPELLLEAMAELDLPHSRFVQVGGRNRAFERYRGRVDIEVTGQVTPARAAELMRGASLLYLKQGGRADGEGNIAVAAKTYEYLATGLPVLAECPPGDNARMVERFAPHAYLVTEPDREAMKAALRDACERRGERVPTVRPEFVENFSRSALTARLAAELDGLCEPAPASAPAAAVPRDRKSEVSDAR